jgi:TonB family protein
MAASSMAHPVSGAAMNIASPITILAAAVVLSIPALSFADGASCSPRLLQSETKFPLRSQLRGHEGIVYVNVKVGEDGRVTDAQLNRSSGYRLLDRSATRSVVENWVFDVSSCEGKAPATPYLVAVQFKNDQY